MDVLPLVPCTLALLYVRKYHDKNSFKIPDSPTYLLAFIITRFVSNRRELNEICSSMGRVSQTHYTRLIAISSIVLFLTLPIYILNAVLDIIQETSLGDIAHTFPGWKEAHINMNVIAIYGDNWRTSKMDMGITYFEWITDCIFAYAVFALFGTTREMRECYWRLLGYVTRPFGIKLRSTRDPNLSDLKFGSAPTKRYVKKKTCRRIIDQRRLKLSSGMLENQLSLR